MTFDGLQFTITVSASPTYLKFYVSDGISSHFFDKMPHLHKAIRPINDILNRRSRSTTVNCQLSTVIRKDMRHA